MKKTTVLLSALLILTSTAAALETGNDMPEFVNIFQGEEQIYSIELVNSEAQPAQASIDVEGDISNVVEIQDQVNIPAESAERVGVRIVAEEAESRLHTGSVTIENGRQISIPLAVRVIERETSNVKLDVQTTSDSIRPDHKLRIFTVVGVPDDLSVETDIEYRVRNAETGEILYNRTVVRNFSGTESFATNLTDNETLGIGSYYVQSSLTANNETVTSTAPFTVSDPFWSPTKFKILVFLIAVGIIAGGGFYTRRWYIQKKQDESRYVFPVDYSKLPAESEDNYWLGKIAETSKDAYIDPKDLTTHAIVSGSTGSGKSVSAGVIAEEALENDVPVVVFDPTAQWTGFVKELKDDDLYEHYDRFDMDENEDSRPYPGIIKEISSGDPDIDFEQLKQPGEITVFTLDQLTTEEFDSAVRNIIDQIFDKSWEESPTLEMLIVFDEVHRLLEEYGGEGGYEALEKGAREFRKWGIGLMMCSQVTADFKQAISGNIMTEVQLQTKSMEDINRVEKKYGEEYSKRISSEDIGVAMIQNSNYNDGEPWFVDFRPTYHNPHRISDEEMEKYHDLSQRLDSLREKLESEGDTEDKELELNLADQKLKEGRFKMAKMYIESLEDELGL